MKCKAFREYDDYEIDHEIYRKCVLLDLNKLEIYSGFEDEEDKIIDPEELHEGTICLDPLIAPAVLILNRKGYKTMFSCEGHYDKDVDGKGKNVIITPFIMFEAGDVTKYARCLTMLPRQFELAIDTPALSKDSTVEEEIKAAYGESKYNGSPKKRITIYSDLVYAWQDGTDSIDANKITEEEFKKYNRKDIDDITTWVCMLPDLKKEAK